MNDWWRKQKDRNRREITYSWENLVFGTLEQESRVVSDNHPLQMWRHCMFFLIKFRKKSKHEKIATKIRASSKGSCLLNWYIWSNYWLAHKSLVIPSSMLCSLAYYSIDRSYSESTLLLLAYQKKICMEFWYMNEKNQAKKSLIIIQHKYMNRTSGSCSSL